MDLTSKIGTAEFDAALTDAASTSQVATTLSIFIMNALRTDPSLDLAQIEDRLRFLRLHAHLIANPAHRAPEGLSVIGTDRRPRPYSLWICVQGREEAEEMLDTIGTKDFAENREKLLETGYLTVGAPTAH